MVIPAYKESSLLRTFQSLRSCESSNSKVEVIVVFNSSENDLEAIKMNTIACSELKEWIQDQDLPFDIQIIEENQLREKEAGVGLARKMGMDEAVRRSLLLDAEDPIILCLDADCQVSSNYFVSIEEFSSTSKKKVASIYFEHPLSGKEYTEEIYEAITYYELHLRYFKNAMKYIGIPYDRHTVGSSIAVKCSAYIKEGGMNKRKAGEDFYFLQKYLIQEELAEINSCIVYPSPRMSDRVPFGTGRAIMDHDSRKKDITETYSAHSFRLLKNLYSQILESYPHEPELASEWTEFIGLEEWQRTWSLMVLQSKDIDSFKKRFFQWFTPFRLLKFIHFLRDGYFANDSLTVQVKELLLTNSMDVAGQLKELRERDRRISNLKSEI